MRVAIVHYHLNHGGVTSVIRTASRVLTESGVRHAVFTEENVPGLGYLAEPGALTAETLVESLLTAADEDLGGPPDVWHFHNHSLGKNRLLPEVVAQLAAAGERLVLQIHDLAEQGRPENQSLIADEPNLYPFSPRIHYVFLNSRDLDLFSAAGLPGENAVVLPNPISIPDFPPPRPPDSTPPLLFAPVRGIRRKNLGELVFLAALAREGTRVAVSRAPGNPAALPIHDHWKNFSATHRLPIGFDVVDRYSPVPGAATGFDSWVSHATHFVTTSVSEGFGMAFLEAISHDKPLVGRNLPHVTADHAAHGIRAGFLYDAILIPIEWVDLRILRDHLTLDLERDHRFYQQPLTELQIELTLNALVRDGMVDFGNLPEPLQQGIVERLAEPSQRRIPVIRCGGDLTPAIDWLAETLTTRTPTATRDQLAPYSPDNYQKSVIALYRRILEPPVETVRHVPPSAILNACRKPENFHFLLTSLRPEPPAARRFRAVIFDIYGTLLIAPPGGVKPDPFADPIIREILRQAGYDPPGSPSTELHAAVQRHHTASAEVFPEIDLRVLWREILSIEPGTDITSLVIEIEEAWHPSRSMPGADKFIQRLSRSGISLGLFSNAQCNTLPSLGGMSYLFAPELTILSYQHGVAKPSPSLFQILADRLAGRGIEPDETLYIGNDPLQDIAPASAAGFKTALFTGHPDSIRPGDCNPDINFAHWKELLPFFDRSA